MRQFFAIFLKTLLYLLLTVVGLVLGIGLGLQIPAVQTRIAQEVARRVSGKLLFPVDIQHVSIKWFDSVTLEGVSIKDYQNRPMITVGRLDANYDLQNLIDSSAYNLHIDEVVLYRPAVRMIKNPKTGDTNLDEFIARIEELTANPDKPGIPNQNVPFTISHIHLVDGAYTLEDSREPVMNDRNSFDYNHFTLQNLNAEVSNFLVLGDTIAFDAKGLSGVDRDSRLKIRQLDTRFLYCAKKMEMAKLYAHIGNSIIRHELTFYYDKPSAFSHFNSRVLMRASFRDSEVRSKDLGYFSSYLRDLNETWQLSGIFTGTVNEFRLSHTDLRFGTNGRSRLAGTLSWKGLPDIDRTTVDFAFTPSVVNMADVRQYYPDTAFNHTIQKLGTVAFDATFAGAFDDFKTKGQFRTAIGNVTGNLKLTLADSARQATTYTANLRAEQLDLGQLIDQPGQFGKLDGEGQLTGRGTDLERANVDVNGRLNRFSWQGYDYRNVVVQGNLQKAFFQGHAEIEDPNLGFVLNGEFDLNGPRNRYDLQGRVHHANLRALGYLRDSLVLKTDLDVQLDGNKLDDLVGTARFRSATLRLNQRSLTIDTLSILSSIETPTGRADSIGTQRYFDLDSDLLTARLQGNFQPQRTFDDLTQLIQEYALYFAGDAAGMKQYYEQKQRTSPPTQIAGTRSRYTVDYQFIAKEIKPLLTFLDSSIYVAPATRMEGRFTKDNTAFLTTTIRTDSLRFGTLGFGPGELDLTTSKLTYGEEVLASAVLSSQRQTLSTLLPTRNLQAEASWDVDHINFTSSIEQAVSAGQQLPNRADLNGELRFKGDAIDLTFRQSQVRLLDGNWILNPQSLIRKVGDAYTIRNLSMVNQDQVILASGQLSPDSVESLLMEARSFRLESLNPVLNTVLGGTLNGTLAVRDVYNTPIVESELAVSQLAYQKTLIGDVRGRGAWDQPTRRLNVVASLNRAGADVLTLQGTYNPEKKQNPLALKANLNDANLNILEPFTTDLFSNLGGTASGLVTVSGTPSAPALNGEVTVKSGRGRFDYLKADFTFDDKIYFGENEIITRRLTLRDPDGNTALLRGGVYHDGFRYFTLGFDADFRNFRIMNTAAKDNDLFYGQAVVTGKAELFGPLDNLTIRANVASNKGTRIYIPLDGATSVASDDQIRFVNRSGLGLIKSTGLSGTRPNNPANGDVDLSRIQMDFNFDVTPDAYCEIQLDRQTGDIIKAYGQGRLGMRVDTKGDFTMTGNYEIQRGDYTFTFQNIINKRFLIQPGSRMTWTGDPYGALLDVTASYVQYTSLAPLLATSSGSDNRADQSRRYPVDLSIKLNGDLASPAINYDLDIKEYPASSEFRQAVTAFESRLQSNDQELTRQVSSVLLFNQLLSENTSFFDQNQVNSGVANSVSELLSNQISRLASNLNENLDVGVSFGGFMSGTQNENLLNNLQLRFSYRFLNDRLRISRDGGFTYGQSQYNAASLLGEWTLEYFITPDGRFRAKMYNRNQQSALSQYSLNSTITTGGGLSFLYTRSFNRLFGSKRNAPGLVPPSTNDEPTSAPVSGPTPPSTGTGRGFF